MSSNSDGSKDVHPAAGNAKHIKKHPLKFGLLHACVHVIVPLFSSAHKQSFAPYLSRQEKRKEKRHSSRAGGEKTRPERKSFDKSERHTLASIGAEAEISYRDA